MGIAAFLIVLLIGDEIDPSFTGLLFAGTYGQKSPFAGWILMRKTLGYFRSSSCCFMIIFSKVS